MRAAGSTHALTSRIPRAQAQFKANVSRGLKSSSPAKAGASSKIFRRKRSDEVRLARIVDGVSARSFAIRVSEWEGGIAKSHRVTRIRACVYEIAMRFVSIATSDAIATTIHTKTP
jgi:hypothetical protein